MKTYLKFLAGSLTALMVTPAMAQLKVQVEDKNPPAAQTPVQSDRVEVQANKVSDEVDARQIRATSLIGMTLQDQQGQQLGKVTDIVLDLNTQTIQYVLINNQDQADAYYALPPTVLHTRYDSNQQTPIISTNVPAAQFREAPVFTQQNWTVRGVDPNWAQKNSVFYRQYSTRPGVDRRIDRIERQEDRLQRRIENRIDNLNK